MKKQIWLTAHVMLGLCLAWTSPCVFGQEPATPVKDEEAQVYDPDSFIAPQAVQNQLRDDLESHPSFLGKNFFEPLDEWKKWLYDKTGLKIGGDYNALYLIATDSLGDQQSGSDVFRGYGSWELLGRGTPDTGSLIYKVEYRHGYTDVAPTDLASELGYVGRIQLAFSNQGFRTTNLYWRQSLFNSRGVAYLGFLDVTDYVDVYGLTSPWTSFNNFAFSTGSASIGGLPDGSLGAMVGVWVTDNIYAVGGLADANSDPTDVFEGFDTFFEEFETFKSVELGWTRGLDRIFLENIHLTFWQIDEREKVGTSDGWGLSFSATTTIDDQWLPFIRGGWAKDGGSLLEASASTGLGYQLVPGGDVLGVGINWGRPNHDTFGADLNDQFTSEVFYRWQVTQHSQLTPSIQLLANPALNPDTDLVAVFGLRARVVF
jgi:porin